jgi:hypothetical protein
VPMQIIIIIIIIIIIMQMWVVSIDRGQV